MWSKIHFPRLIAALAVAVLATACDRSGAETAAPTTTHRTTTTSTSTTTTSTTSTTVVAPTAPGLGQGSKGPEVLALEQKLNAQKYDTGQVDGTFDAATFHAVMAFQKVHGLTRNGRAGPEVLNLIDRVGAPLPLLPDGGANRVEVSLPKQILQLFKNGELYKVVDVSTGSGKKYCVDGECATAVTPGGSYQVFFRRNGWRTSRRGKLYNPLYFNGGIAIHGAPSVPAYPASHGCVRIPMYVSYWFPNQVPNGTPVYVLGGAKAAVPFNEAAPDGTTGTGGPATTSTSTPPTTDGGIHIFPTTSTVPPTTTTSTTTPSPIVTNP